MSILCSVCYYESVTKLITRNFGFILLLLLVVCFLVLRLYRIYEMAPFEQDQEYTANFTYSVIKEYPIQLVGQGLAIQGTFSAPLYFYFFVPFYLIFNLHPIAGAIGSVVFGLITLFVYFFVLKEIFGEKVALIGSFFRTFIFTFINADWSATPAYQADLMIVLTFYSFYKIWHGNFKFLPVLALIFGLYSSIHPSLFPFYLVFLIIFLIKFKLFKQKLYLKLFLLSLVLFILPNLSLLLFDYFRHFEQIQSIFAFKIGSGEGKLNSENLMHYFSTIFIYPYQITGLKFLPTLLIPLIFIGGFILGVMKKFSFFKDNFHKVFLFASFISFIIYYLKFPKVIPEYYFQSLVVLNIIYFSATLGNLLNKKVFLPVFFIILISCLYYNLNLLKIRWDSSEKAAINLYQKDQVVKEILKNQKESGKFSVTFITNLGWKNGYDYLFKMYGVIPSKEINHPIYTIISPTALSRDSIRFSSGNVGLIPPEKLNP